MMGANRLTVNNDQPLIIKCFKNELLKYLKKSILINFNNTTRLKKTVIALAIKIPKKAFSKSLSYVNARANAITKLARSNNSAVGSTLYITLSPCRECAKLIHQAGISRLVYRNEYKDAQGLEFLRQAGVELVRLEQPAA